MKRISPYLVGAILLIGALVLVVRRERPDGPPTREESPLPASATAERPAAEPTSASLDLVRELLDPAGDLSEQIAAVRALPDGLSLADLTVLKDFLRRPQPERIRQGHWHALLNAVMEVLCEPRFKWAGYGGAMGGLVRDRAVDPVVRDYAAQHLALWLGDELTAAVAAGGFAPAMDAYTAVLGDERDAFEPVTGTILMVLCDLRSRRQASDFQPYQDVLNDFITRTVSGASPASLPNRISAIQAAGRLGVTDALPAIRSLARGAAPNPSIRLSSVAALGYFRLPADRPFLEELAAGDSGLRKAAAAALRNHRL